MVFAAGAAVAQSTPQIVHAQWQVEGDNAWVPSGEEEFFPPPVGAQFYVHCVLKLEDEVCVDIFTARERFPPRQGIRLLNFSHHWVKAELDGCRFENRGQTILVDGTVHTFSALLDPGGGQAGWLTRKPGRGVGAGWPPLADLHLFDNSVKFRCDKVSVSNPDIPLPR
ncbi:MAG TPA: hypothetical protein VG798_00770 [Rhizomicrobium sp.]|nr:hypothetical protein [Rhizomicrobium sp.]